VGDNIAKVIEDFLVTRRSERLDKEIDSIHKYKCGINKYGSWISI
jgi:hypothetical protein